MITIEGQFNWAEVQVELVDFTGKIIANKTVVSQAKQLQVGFSSIELPQGFYLLKVKGTGINLGYKLQVD